MSMGNEISKTPDLETDQFISPVIRDLQLHVGEDATRGDARAIPVQDDVRQKLIELSALAGMQPVLMAPAEGGNDYWVSAAVTEDARSQTLGVVHGPNTFTLRGLADVLYHEKVHQEISRTLAPDAAVLGPAIHEALAFAIQAAIFGSDVDQYLRAYTSSSYTNREARLTGLFLGLYYILGLGDLIGIAKMFADTIKKSKEEGKEVTLDELIMLFDQHQETSLSSIRQRVQSFFDVTNPTEQSLIFTYFTMCFGVSEQTAKKIMAQQNYKNLEEAASDLSPAKVHAIAEEKRLTSFFTIATKQRISEVRARVAKIVELDLQRDVAASIYGMEKFTSQLAETFGDDAVRDLMEIVIMSPLMAEKLNNCMSYIVGICANDRTTPMLFAQKFSTDIHFKRWLLEHNGMDYIQSALGKYCGDSNKKSQLLREILDFDYRLLNAPFSLKSTLPSSCDMPAYNKQKNLIEEINMPIETHLELIALIPRIIAVAAKRNLMGEGFETWAEKRKKLGFIDHIHRTISFKIILEIAKTAADAEFKNQKDQTQTNDDMYKAYCKFTVSRVEQEIKQLEDAFAEFVALTQTGKILTTEELCSEEIICGMSASNLEKLAFAHPELFNTRKLVEKLDTLLGGWKAQDHIMETHPEFFQNNDDMLKAIGTYRVIEKHPEFCTASLLKDIPYFLRCRREAATKIVKVRPDLFRGNPEMIALLPEAEDLRAQFEKNDA